MPEIPQPLYPDCPLVRVDWKASSDDILYALQDVFAAAHPFLLEESFAELEENLSAEPTEEVLAAYGQEISAHGMALVSIDEGNDEYCLVMVPLATHKDVIKAVKKSSQKRADIWKQSHKKLGTPAKRIQLSKRLQVEEFVMNDNSRHTWSERSLNFLLHSRYVLREHRIYRDEGGGKKLFSSWLDKEPWPPTYHACSAYIYRYAYSHSHALWALLVGRPELENTPEEYLPSKRTRQDGSVRITPNPIDETTWQAIPFPDESEATYSHICWIDDDLFFEQEGTVWVLRGITSLHLANITPQSWQKLFVIEKDHDWFSYMLTPYAVKTGDGTSYLAMGPKLYTWSEGTCTPLPFSLRQGHQGNMVASGKHTLMYVDSQDRLVELDVHSGKERFRPLQLTANWVSLHSLDNGWLAMLPGGRVPSGAPIALLWHKESDEWLGLFRGALGREELRHAEPRPDGSVLLFTSNHRLYRVFDLVSQVRALAPKKQLEVAEWSDDPEEGSSTWFYTAMEEELGLSELRRIEPLGKDKAMLHAKEGIFWVAGSEGLWNKLHADRKAKRPTHNQKIFGDGSFDYRVYIMHTLDNLEFYRSYPPSNTPALEDEPEQGTPGQGTSGQGTPDQGTLSNTETKTETGAEQQDAKNKGGFIAALIAYILFAGVLVYTLVKLVLVMPVLKLVKLVISILTKPFK